MSTTVQVTLFPTKSPRWLRGTSADGKITVQVHSQYAKAGEAVEVKLGES